MREQKRIADEHRERERIEREKALIAAESKVNTDAQEAEDENVAKTQQPLLSDYS